MQKQGWEPRFEGVPIFFIVSFRPRNNNTKQDSTNFQSGHSIIAQLLSMVPMDIFKQVVEEENADRYYKKLNSVDHFICMFYAVLTRNGSLREVCKNITLIAKMLIPFGFRQLPAKSTLSDANRKRDSALFENLYRRLYEHYRPALKSKWSEIGDEVDPSQVEVFDSTTIGLFKDMLQGAGRNPINGKKKGGAKAFTKMNLAEGVPNFVCIKAASTNEHVFLKLFELPEHSIGVCNMGFASYSYYSKLTVSNRYFVARKKDNATYEVVREFDCSHAEDIQKDQLISLKYKEKRVSRTVEVRLVPILIL